jgi:SAM-dependent methyltransferase
MSLYESISGYYDEIFPLKAVRLSFLDSILKEGLTVLDIGCAGGELALALAGKGHHAVGIDLDEGMITLAKGKAQKQGLQVDFFAKDMTKIGDDFPPASFDAVLCVGNTLVHLENLEKIREMFLSIYKILKNSSIVVIQVVNYDRVLSREIKVLPLLESENFTFRREYDYDREKHRIGFLTSLTVKKSGQVLENRETLYPLTFNELKAALSAAGFAELHFFGSESMVPYDKQGPALLVVAKKP